MARKLSEVTRRGLAIASVAAVQLAPINLRAEQPTYRTASPAVVQNPFAAAVTKPPTYRNPFAGRSSDPPAAPPLRQGPISRWTPATPMEPSPIKSAILSAESVADIQIPWNESSPQDSLRSRTLSRSESPAAGMADPPDPVQFAATPLAQPEWLAESAAPPKPLSPIGHASFNQPIGGDLIRAPAKVPLEPSRPITDFAPIVVSDLDDSPHGWLARAKQAAGTAESLHDLSAVAQLCERGLSGRPSAALSTALRELAAWAHNRRGELLAEADQPQQAMQDFQRAIALDANCSLAVHNRGVTLAEQNQFAAALRDFNRVIELNPGLAIAYRNRAELLAAVARTEEALADYDRAIESLPDDAELYAARAYAGQRLGDFDRARDDLNRALEIAPDRPATWAQRGNLAADLGDYDAARADFERAVGFDPDCAEAHRSMAWLQATCADESYRDSQEALAAALKAADLAAPGEYLVLDTLAAAHAAAGQFDEAVRVQQQAIAAAPTDFAKPLRHRLSLYQAGRPYRAKPQATR